MAEKTKIEYKIVVVGTSFVGKSSVSRCYVGEEFSTNREATIGAAFFQNIVPLDSKRELVLGIWDTAGQERFRSMVPMYYRGASVAILVYDVTDQSSFDALQDFIDDITKIIPDVFFFIAGNKTDKPVEEHVVDFEEAKDLGESVGAPVFLTSARTGAGVQELFKAVSDTLKQEAERVVVPSNSNENNIVNLRPAPPRKPSSCC